MDGDTNKVNKGTLDGVMDGTHGRGLGGPFRKFYFNMYILYLQYLT